MKTVDRICEVLFYIVGAIGLTLAFNSQCSSSAQVVERDYDYEAYCDSIWEANPDYYMDILAETDDYQEYINTVGQWWEL